MALKRLLRPTNRKVRLAVGLLIAGLFCIQCTSSSQANKTTKLVVIGGVAMSGNTSEMAAKVEQLAKKDHIALLEYCLQNCQERYQDYTCTFIKQEQINGIKGKEQWIHVKFKNDPFSVVMAWTPETAPLGDRFIYVEGKNDGQMLVRPRGILGPLVGTVKRQPDGPEAMQNTLRPVTMFGFERSLKSLLEVYDKAKQHGDLKEEFGGHADVAGRKCVVLVRYLPAKDDYPAAKTVICIDTEYLLPISVEGYDWENRCTSRYIFKDLKFNVGLKDSDFTPEANDMKRPK